MTFIRTFLIFGLVLTGSAQADPDCYSLQSTAEISDCGGVEFKKADNELNAVYGKLLKILDSEGQRRLKESQRAWIKFRDANADFRADLDRGGTLEPITVTASKTEITEQRAKELKSQIDLRK